MFNIACGTLQSSNLVIQYFYKLIELATILYKKYTNHTYKEEGYEYRIDCP